MCVVYCVFWLPKPRVLKVRMSSLIRAHAHVYVFARHENENIKNVENTEIEYVWGFKQHYVVASIGFSIEENAFYFAIFGGCRGRVIVSLGQ